MFENDVVYIGRYCPICGQYHRVFIYEDDYAALQNGALAQEVFNHLTLDEWEMLISGICPKCWSVMFGDEDEDTAEEEECEDFEPDYDECGYNPYMGCYDFDC